MVKILVLLQGIDAFKFNILYARSRAVLKPGCSTTVCLCSFESQCTVLLLLLNTVMSNIGSIA
jgi:hypothetical protein